jgi:hypothetical protein
MIKGRMEKDLVKCGDLPPTFARQLAVRCANLSAADLRGKLPSLLFGRNTEEIGHYLHEERSVEQYPQSPEPMGKDSVQPFQAEEWESENSLSLTSL